MSNLKKELEEALATLENSNRDPDSDKEKITMIKAGKINKDIKNKFKIKGWCFTGDHPIIDLDGGE